MPMEFFFTIMWASLILTGNYRSLKPSLFAKYLSNFVNLLGLCSAGFKFLIKVFHKAGEFIGNKNENPVTNPNDDNVEKQEPIEEIIIPPEKRENILNKLRKVL